VLEAQEAKQKQAELAAMSQGRGGKH